MDIIKRNFFGLLRAGAFDETEKIEPMSAFKWRRLYQMSVSQSVVSFFMDGADKCKNYNGLNIPESLIKEIKKDYISNITEEKDINFNLSDFNLSAKPLNKRLKNIIEKEHRSIDTSTETLHILAILLHNVNCMLNYGISIRGIIELGLYLRIKGDKVDFIKLDTWLKELHLNRIAQLQGSFLMAVFKFEQNELPFVEKYENDAYKLILRSASHIIKDTAEEWHFKQSKTGFVRNNNKVLRRNLKRSVRYIDYATIETVCNFINNFTHSLSEIEE